MAPVTCHLLKIFAFLLAGSKVYLVQSGNTAPRRHVTQPPVFLQAPQRIHYFVSRDQPANLTWVATNVCKMQIRCNGKKFDEGEKRVCGKTCNKCKTRKRTKIITVSNFPKNVRSMTCQCKAWGTTAVRADEKIVVEKAFLHSFSAVQLKHVKFSKTSVILYCLRVTSKNDLVIKRLCSSAAGKYQSVAENMVARREGLVMTLKVRDELRSRQSGLGTAVLLQVLLIVVLVVVAYVSVRMSKKYFSRPADPECMSRNSEGETLAADKSIGIGRTDFLSAGAQLSNDSPDLSQQMSSNEPSGANEVSKDPPVQLQRNVVNYYTTKVEQYGGVMILGDRANINHHYPPQN